MNPLKDIKAPAQQTNSYLTMSNVVLDIITGNKKSKDGEKGEPFRISKVVFQGGSILCRTPEDLETPAGGLQFEKVVISVEVSDRGVRYNDLLQLFLDGKAVWTDARFK
jgi:hypothetical protein